MKHILDYQLTVSQNGREITSELTGPGLINELRETLWRRVMDTQEEGVRKALIEMGWTPPKDPS